MSVDISQAICQAVGIIVDQKLNNAQFNRVIEGTITSVINKVTKQYYVSYEGSPRNTLAYAINNDVYQKKTPVILLASPTANITYILGKRQTIDNNDIDNIQDYTIMGNNIVYGSSDISIFNLCSYKGHDEVNLFNSIHTGATANDRAIINNIQSSNGLILSAIISTRLMPSQIGGNYGVKFDMAFKKSGTNTIYNRTYQLDVRDIVGVNPYLSHTEIEVKHFLRDGENFNLKEFQYVRQVTVFCQSFPDNITNEQGELIKNLNPIPAQYYDIHIANPAICDAYILTDQESAEYNLFLNPINGQQIPAGNTSITACPVEAILKKQGIEAQVAEQSVQSVEITGGVKYRWFIQDESVTSVDNIKYNKYAGLGWSALSTKNFKKFYFTNVSATFPAENYYSFASDKIIVKCIAFLSGQHWEKEITIYYDSTIKLTITNDKVSNSENNNYIFNVNYNGPNNNNKIKYTCNVINGASGTTYKYYWTEKSQYVDKKSQGSTSKNYYSDNIALMPKGTVSCSVYIVSNNTQVFLGTASITVFYKPSTGNYYLNIQGGDKMLQYDENGNFISSNSGTIIEPITFELIDPSGAIIDKPDYNNSNNSLIKNWIWEIPKEKTVIKAVTSQTFDMHEITNPLQQEISIPAENINNYVYYKGRLPQSSEESIQNNLIGSFYYAVNKYDINATNNTIKLYVSFKKNNEETVPTEITANITFSPVKVGDPGTNGTNTIAFIQPYDSNNNTLNTRRSYVVTNDVNSDDNPIQYTDSGELITGYKLFLQKDNNNIIINNNTGTTTWSIPFKNNFNTSHSYTSYFAKKSSTKSTFILKKISSPGPSTYDNTGFAYTSNILRANFKFTNSDLPYYAEYPICYTYAYINSSTGSFVKLVLEADSGFTYVKYSSAGTNPQYDGNNRFVLKFFTTGGIDTTNRSDKIFEWSIFKNIGLEIESTDRNVAIINPKPQYDGNDIRTAICCKVTYTNSQGNPAYAFIQIPIYMYLNRYNYKNLNDWDGNSIDINNDGSYILAPQMGAGKKENNKFSGVLMGEVKPSTDSNKESDIGILGFNKGIRTIFLNAEDGTGTFGAQGKGQIVINGTKSVITGGTYTTEGSGSGMEIDLADPHIKYGNGKFLVNKNGILSATEANISGTITATGGKIGGVTLYSDNNTDTAGIGTKSFTAAQINTSFPFANVSSNYTGILWGSNQNTDIENHLTFLVSHKGALFSNTGNIAGWKIEEDRFSRQQTGTGTVFKTFIDANPNNEFFLWAGNGTGTSNRIFSVSKQGILYAKGATISGNIEAGSTIGSNNAVSSTGNLLATQVGMGRTSSAIDVSNFPGITGTRYLNLWGKSDGNSLSKANLIFGITENGEVLANSAHITGTINATGGQIANWTIGSSKITYGNVGMGSNVATRADLNSAFNTGYDTSGSNITLRYWAGSNTDNKQLSFAVSNAGTLYAKGAYIAGKITTGSGSIGGWTINSSSLSTVGTKGAFNIRKASSDSTKIIEATNDGTSVFSVTAVGKLTATNADITGKITATEGSFKGTITATSGKIAKWTISNEALTQGYVGLGNKVITAANFNSSFGTNLTKDATLRLWGGASDSTLKFAISSSGTLYAQNANISGEITATKLTITENATISGLKVKNADIESVNIGKVKGKLSGDNITIDFSNGNVSLDSLSANKITAGTVNGQSVSWRQMNIVNSVSYTQAGTEGNYKIRVQNASGTETWLSGMVISSLNISTGNYYLLIGNYNNQ